MLLGELSAQAATPARMEPHRLSARLDASSFRRHPAARFVMLHEPQSGRHDRETVEPRSKKAAKIGAIEGQQNIGRREGTEQDRPVLLHGKHCRPVDRQHIVNQIESSSQPQPRDRDRSGEARQIPVDFVNRVRRCDQTPVPHRCPMKELPGRHPPPRRPRRSARSSRETASRPRSKPPHVRLVFRDPAGNLIGRERSRLGEQGALGPESRRQKEHQFLLLGRRECRGGRFDFGKSEHGHRRTPYSAHLPRESAARCRNRHGTGRVLFGRWAARERARLAAVRAVPQGG